jgi:hypothetical protein
VAQLFSLGIIRASMRLTLSFFALSLLLTSCDRTDVRRQRELVGTWFLDFTNGVHSTWTVRPDGSYFGRLDGYANGKVVSFEGHVLVHGDELIDTCTKHSDTNAICPFVETNYILHLDMHELTAIFAASPEPSVTLRKVDK